jgi:hypothetical protein
VEDAALVASGSIAGELGVAAAPATGHGRVKRQGRVVRIRLWGRRWRRGGSLRDWPAR